MKKVVGSGAGSISQRYGSRDPNPDPHQSVTDPQHCLLIWSVPKAYINTYVTFFETYLLDKRPAFMHARRPLN